MDSKRLQGEGQRQGHTFTLFLHRGNYDLGYKMHFVDDCLYMNQEPDEHMVYYVIML